ncbi:hypothetical protein [Actinomadura chokoriensis]|uniref:DUF5667 domain-containing protein n=1 Tax=Actinomadura chokoriensis TaxID=454156 RepID=A0ABV4R5F7_9ACTN
MRCNAPLPPDGGATARDETLREPFGEAPGPHGPVPPPWAEQSPIPWESAADYTSPMPPSEERSISLSREPWDEPAIWQPPAPRRKSRLPYFLGAAGAVLLIGVAAAIVFWPSGSSPSGNPPAAAQSSGQPSDQPSQGVVSETEDAGDLGTQAGAVNGLLEEMGSTRSDLGSVVADGCPASGLQRILDARKGQLERARTLEVSALDNGVQMKDALVRALEASTESNQRYLDTAPGCPSEGEVADVNQRASSAKSEFIGYWTPIAEQAGLPARSEGDI